MGMFDRVVFKKPKFCIHCREILGREFQTKDLQNALLTFNEGEEINKVIQEHLISHDAMEFSDDGYGRIEVHNVCPKCGRYISLNVGVRKWKIENR